MRPGLRSSAKFGPCWLTPPRGPLANSRSAFTCASLMSFSASGFNLGVCVASMASVHRQFEGLRERRVLLDFAFDQRAVFLGRAAYRFDAVGRVLFHEWRRDHRLVDGL